MTRRRRIARKLHLSNSYGLTDFGMLVGFLGTIALVVCVVLGIVFVGTTYGGRAYGRPACRNWGTQTGIPTKFVILNWADSGTCLARTPDGRWVLNTNWQAFVNGGKP